MYITTGARGGPGDQSEIQSVYNCCSQEQADMVDVVVQLRFEIDALYETHNLPISEHSRPPPGIRTQPVKFFVTCYRLT